jgi:hypothetical protein
LGVRSSARPCHHLARAERVLGDVVVGAQLQPGQAISFVGARGEHQDGHAGECPQLAAQAQAVQAGQHQVQQHQIVAALGPGLQRIAAVGHAFGLVAGGAQVVGQQCGELGFVFDHEHPRRARLQH